MNDYTQKILIAICLAYFLPILAFSQICSGSLGDPVVNIDFGRGPNPGPALPNALPSLTYYAAGCPNDGMYTLANSIGDCFGNTWHNYSADHTPNDVNGYMMIVNASFNSGDFYLDTVKGLCGGTTYEFAAWITNVFRANAMCTSVNPTIQFTIETVTGTVLATYIAGNIPVSTSPIWKQHGVFFTTPVSSSSLVLRMANKAPGGCGNDLAIDDITFRPCGPAVNVSAVGATGPAIHQCADNIKPVQLQASIGAGYSNPNTLWQKSIDTGKTWTDISPVGTSTTASFLPSGTGTTLVRVTVADGGNINLKECRIASNEFQIVVHELPGTGASITSPVCEKELVTLNAGMADQFLWTGPNGFTSTKQTSSLVAQKINEGNYFLQVADIYGCTASKTFALTVNAAPVAVLADSMNICENEIGQLAASGGSSYRWQPAEGLSASNIPDPIVSISNTKSYQVIVGNAGNCFDTASIKVIIDAAPSAEAGPDQYISEGQQVTLLGKATGTNINWYWSPNTFINNVQAIQPVVSPSDDIAYKLTVQSSNGCPGATDSVFVRVYKKIIIPNAFSPNGDGINDIWRIEGLFTYPAASVLVFDRYGQVAFKSKGYSQPWNGSRNGVPMPVGVYYYVINLKNGSPAMKGSVFIIR